MLDIIIYTTPTCQWCKKLKTWLKRRRLAFEEHDLTDSDKASDEMIEISGLFLSIGNYSNSMKYSDSSENIVNDLSLSEITTSYFVTGQSIFKSRSSHIIPLSYSGL